jgi:hypothetical protein
MRYKGVLDKIDKSRQIVFSVLYMVIDLIGYAYEKQGFFSDRTMSKED